MMLFGISLLFIGLFLGMIGYAVDEATVVHLALVGSSTMPVSQERVETVHWLLMLFRSLAVMIPIGIGISYWAMSTREVPGEI